MSESQPGAHALDYVEKTVNGEPVKFGKLSVRDRVRILQEAKRSTREERAKTAKDAGLPPDQTYAELRAHEAGVWGLGRWAELANDFAGQEKIYTTALQRKGYSAEQINKVLENLSFPHEEEMALVCELANLPLVAPAPPNMRQVGVIDGQPVYVAVNGKAGDEADPTQAAQTPPTKGNPPSYGK